MEATPQTSDDRDTISHLSTQPTEETAEVANNSEVAPLVIIKDLQQEIAPVSSESATYTDASGVKLVDVEAKEEKTELNSNKEQSSSSESSSDSSDSEDDLPILSEGSDGETGAPPKSKNELVQLPEVKKIEKIPESSKIDRIGVVSHAVDNYLVIQADKDSRALDIDSVLCLEDKTPIGQVEEVFGPVSLPFYTVRFNSSDEHAKFAKGSAVFGVLDMSSFVVPSEIYTKGSDASGEYDEEPPPESLEYSDDEAERIAKTELKKKRKKSNNKKNKKNQKASEIPNDTAIAAASATMPTSNVPQATNTNPQNNATFHRNIQSVNNNMNNNQNNMHHMNYPQQPVGIMQQQQQQQHNHMMAHQSIAPPQLYYSQQQQHQHPQQQQQHYLSPMISASPLNMPFNNNVTPNMYGAYNPQPYYPQYPGHGGFDFFNSQQPPSMIPGMSSLQQFPMNPSSNIQNNTNFPNPNVNMFPYNPPK